ncbi:hypothetical protein [Streptomyces sp. NRRL S-378]|uniref:hypothetical protein n=1 Tax=Streptomyces sp. NRRL S-378 TaxID=1463904 RepID=UPI000AF466D2|nr:hypothetical protein [Streptomyces sp. NRRL S-378]
MFTVDLMNNINRVCCVRSVVGGREWKVRRAVVGDRYLLRNVRTGEHRTVPVRDMHSLY